MIYQFLHHIPVVHPTAYVHPQACVSGSVVIGANVYIGPNAVLRGDWGQIIIEAGCNVQENCTVHMFPGVTVTLHENAHIGHGAVIHGATIGSNCLVGMNAVIMDNAIIGNESIVGALSFVQANAVFEARSVIVGNPAKKVKEVSDEMLHWKTEGTKLYQQLPPLMQQQYSVCEPLTELPNNYAAPNWATYETWKK
jgi:phenylacetic acid degradation protein